MKILFYISLILFSVCAQANELFVIKKTYNPKNILKYTAKLNKCQFSRAPILAQWVMGEEDGHIEDLTSLETKFFLPKITYQKTNEVDFSIGALAKLKDVMGGKAIQVRLKNCVAKAYVELNGEEIQLTEIFATTGMFSQVKSLVVSGIAADGRRIEVEL